MSFWIGETPLSACVSLGSSIVINLASFDLVLRHGFDYSDEISRLILSETEYDEQVPCVKAHEHVGT